MNEFEEISRRLLKEQHFDCFSMGVIDFSKGSFEIIDNEFSNLYFDLASLTKPLTNGLSYFLNPDLFEDDLKMLLEHRAGLPAWGRLSQHDWKKQILSYSIAKSETLYSDFSALRVLLEWENKTGTNLYKACRDIWDDELCSWLDLDDSHKLLCPKTGTRKNNSVRGVVHDDNAFIIGERVSHAGLFGTVSGVCKTLINWDKKFKLLESMSSYLSKIPNDQRFANGWDRVLDPADTLAGQGCSKETFGHLGFTGTSIWIDPSKKRGHVILTNATQNFWYERKGLKELRQTLGALVWAN